MHENGLRIAFYSATKNDILRRGNPYSIASNNLDEIYLVNITCGFTFETISRQFAKYFTRRAREIQLDSPITRIIALEAGNCCGKRKRVRRGRRWDIRISNFAQSCLRPSGQLCFISPRKLPCLLSTPTWYIDSVICAMSQLKHEARDMNEVTGVIFQGKQQRENERRSASLFRNENKNKIEKIVESNRREKIMTLRRFPFFFLNLESILNCGHRRARSRSSHRIASHRTVRMVRCIMRPLRAGTIIYRIAALSVIINRFH